MEEIFTEKTMPPFSQIEAGGNIWVYLTKGKREGVSLPRSLCPDVSCQVVEGRLVIADRLFNDTAGIYMQQDKVLIRPGKAPLFKVEVPKTVIGVSYCHLNKLIIKNAAAILSAAPIVAHDFEVHISDYGHMESFVDVEHLLLDMRNESVAVYYGKAIHTRISMDDTAFLDTTSLKVNSLTISASGRAQAAINASEKLDIKAGELSWILYAPGTLQKELQIEERARVGQLETICMNARE